MLQQKYLKNCFLYAIFNIINIFSQEIPSEFFNYKKQNFLYDFGESWDRNSIFNNIRFYDINQKNIENNLNKDSLYVKSRLGYKRINQDICIYGFGHFIFQKYLYGYLYPRIVNNYIGFKRYSGIPREISRSGFNSGETDISGIGFQNNWLSFQIGRGRETWGAGNKINIILNENSPSYDYGMLSSNYGNIRVRYFHGFLESDNNNINRYISGRGLEWSNGSFLNIGLSEIIIYSGKNRPLDIAYLNPISTHLEIELNDRLNIVGTDGSNAVWQISTDYAIKKGYRISTNLFFDEIVLDKNDLKGKEHGIGYAIRLSKTSKYLNSNYKTLFFSFISIGTPTFRHGIGYNNFVQRGKPLGWEYGSDSKELKFGLNLFNNNNMITNLAIGNRIIGEESIINRPYEKYKDYLKGDFPSGVQINQDFLDIDFQYWLKNYLSLIMDLEIIKSKGNNNISLNFGFDLFFPKSFII
ncbi:MAG: hypothetical protein ACJZ14_01365 [Candidatus Neomarinimicrobiota bacterium]